MKQGEILLRLVQGEDGQAWAEKMYGWSSTSLAGKLLASLFSSLLNKRNINHTQ